MPLVDRRDILEALIAAGQRIQFSQALPGDAKSIFHLIDQAGLEGMVSKRADCVYRSGNSTAWLKIKCYIEKEMDIIGVQRESGKLAMVLMADRAAIWVMPS
jgi:ATP-dependent DNA ligase